MMLRASLLALVLGFLGACGHGPGGKLPVDSPAMPYQAPDIDEISGIDSEDEAEVKEEPAKEPAKGTPPAPAPAPTPKK
ncbi:MAG TPA: hypothetical protein VFQ53_36905 [Kofleriaceae bacterium]|nr:hypothetical protein [Kofleriaceae bacterium]